MPQSIANAYAALPLVHCVGLHVICALQIREQMETRDRSRRLQLNRTRVLAQ
jgi:hypothetical protein